MRRVRENIERKEKPSKGERERIQFVERENIEGEEKESLDYFFVMLSPQDERPSRLSFISVEREKDRPCFIIIIIPSTRDIYIKYI